MRGDVWLRSDTIAGWGRYCLAALRRNSWSRAFFSEIAQGASAKTVWRSMRAEQVSIAERWRRPRSELIRRARSDTGQAAEKCSSGRRASARSEEHTSELQSPDHLVCRLL